MKAAFELPGEFSPNWTIFYNVLAQTLVTEIPFRD